MPAKKLLVIHQGALGDFVLTFPALIRLKAAFPQIDVLCQNKLAKLARKLDLIDNGYALESAVFASLYADRFSRVDPMVKNILQAYDRIILFSYSRQLETMLSRISGADVHRISPRPAPDETIHVAAFIIQRLQAAHLLTDEGPAKEHPPNRYCRPVSGKTASMILLHPGSGSRRKNWPLPNFLKLAEILRSQDHPAEFLLGPAEADLAQELARTAMEDAKIHILTDLEQVLDLMHRAGALIGNDSGISHLAAFTGLPTVAIFGPSNPDQWRPVGRAVAVVKSDIDCAPCTADDQKNCDTKACLYAITSEMVVETLVRLIGDGPPDSAAAPGTEYNINKID